MSFTPTRHTLCWCFERFHEDVLNYLVSDSDAGAQYFGTRPLLFGAIFRLTSCFSRRDDRHHADAVSSVTLPVFCSALMPDHAGTLAARLLIRNEHSLGFYRAMYVVKLPFAG